MIASVRLTRNTAAGLRGGLGGSSEPRRGLEPLTTFVRRVFLRRKLRGVWFIGCWLPVTVAGRTDEGGDDHYDDDQKQQMVYSEAAGDGE